MLSQTKAVTNHTKKTLDLIPGFEQRDDEM
jgi:hypothetical protein